MSWLEKIRSKPRAEKMAIIWTAAIVVCVLLVILWAFAAKIHKQANRDTRLFQTIGQGFKDVKKNFGKNAQP